MPGQQRCVLAVFESQTVIRPEQTTGANGALGGGNAVRERDRREVVRREERGDGARARRISWTGSAARCESEKRVAGDRALDHRDVPAFAR